MLRLKALYDGLGAQVRTGVRMVRVTPKGVQAAKAFYDAVIRVSRGASWAANRTGSLS